MTTAITTARLRGRAGRPASRGAARQGLRGDLLRSREVLVFWGASSIGLLHAVDDAMLHRQPGVGAGQHLMGLLVTVATVAVAAVTFPVLRPGIRAGLALVLGTLTLVNGGTHVAHAAAVGPSASDLSGILAAVAGVALVALGLTIPWRHRGARPGRTGIRWARRAIAVALGALVLLGFLVPVGTAMLQIHQPRHAVGDAPSADYGTVTFQASDGLRLSGWYAPSHNGAAVILVHGGGSDRTGSVAHAEMLHRHGYGVLLYDARGRGDSEGSPNGFGWGWPRDVSGALGYLEQRPDVDPTRIGGLGLSTGASVLLEVAATDDRLAAVVADGAAGRSYADRLPSRGPDVRTPYLWSMYAAARVFSGATPGAHLDGLVAQIAPTPVFLIAGLSAPYEAEFNHLFARAYSTSGRGKMTLWVAPGVHHTTGIRERSLSYESRVADFFDGALLGAGSGTER